MSKANPIKDFLLFYKKAEKLKSTLRHSWLSEANRQESTAEHSWMLGLLAIVLFDHIKTKVNKEKVLKIVLVHDLAEAITGDIPSHEISKRQDNKKVAEKKALIKITSSLNKKTANEIFSLWEEYGECKTPEARFANSLDKIEALLQHNLADIKTWDQGDYNVGPYYKDYYFDFDIFMRSFKDFVDIDTMKKILVARQEKRIDPKHLQRYKSGKK